MKFLPFLFCFFAFGNLQAQDLLPIPNEYIIYFEDGTTPAEVTAIANTWNSTVLQNLQPGTNIAALYFNGSYPFTNPYDPTEQIFDLIGVVGKVKKYEPKGDGGSLNYFIEGHIPGSGGGSSCYTEYPVEHATDDKSIVRVAVFDSGTNWDSANSNGFNFGTAPHEMFGDATDKHGHGTHVATVLNATYVDANNGSTDNVAYVFGNPLNNNGAGTLADMVLSMEDAIKHGAHVINCSFSYVAPRMVFGATEVGPGGPENGVNHGEEDVLYLLMSSANPSTTLFIVSAGNNNLRDLDAPSTLNIYPAAFPLDNMITVASYSCANELSHFSNLGVQSVDIAAPGENIRSLDHEMDWVYYSGTSQAAAGVSGAAAILGTHLPYFHAPTVKCAIMNTAKYQPTLAGKLVTEGVVNLADAVPYIQNNNICAPVLQQKITNKTTNAEVVITPTIFTSDIKVAFDLTADSPVDITIYSLNGQTLSKTTQVGNKGSNEISVNLDHLPTDSYLLIRIDSNEFTKTSKIIRVQ